MDNSLKQILKKRVPGQLVIQMTDHCNARCPQCGMRITEKFRRSRLSADNIKRIIDAAVQKGIKVISFTGGEPMLFLDDLSAAIDYAGKSGIKYIRTGTNGFFFMNSDKPDFQSRINRIAEKLANTPLRNFWISIDSAVPSVHEEMRGLPGVIAGIEKALPVFHDYGIYPSANLGINRNIGGIKTLRVFNEEFRDAFRKFYRFVINLGFTIVNSCYPMSIDNKDKDLNPVYAATSHDSVVQFSPAEKAVLYKALMETIPEFRSKIRIFSPLTSLYVLYKEYSNHLKYIPSAYPCRGGIDFFFISSKDGNTYPCGYRGNENLGKLWNLDLDGLDTKNPCYQCDWECFRDPSELFGPVIHGLSAPFELFRKFRDDPHYFHLWSDDLRYYRACNFFNGREPPDYEELAKT